MRSSNPHRNPYRNPHRNPYMEALSFLENQRQQSLQEFFTARQRLRRVSVSPSVADRHEQPVVSSLSNDLEFKTQAPSVAEPVMSNSTESSSTESFSETKLEVKQHQCECKLASSHHDSDCESDSSQASIEALAGSPGSQLSDISLVDGSSDVSAGHPMPPENIVLVYLRNERSAAAAPRQLDVSDAPVSAPDSADDDSDNSDDSAPGFRV